MSRLIAGISVSGPSEHPALGHRDDRADGAMIAVQDWPALRLSRNASRQSEKIRIRCRPPRAWPQGQSSCLVGERWVAFAKLDCLEPKVGSGAGAKAGSGAGAKAGRGKLDQALCRHFSHASAKRRGPARQPDRLAQNKKRLVAIALENALD
jgi:hypothetical protein